MNLSTKPHFLLFLFTVSIQFYIQAQSYTITVKDSISSEPLIGVNILYQNEGVATDIDGRFEMTNPTFPMTVAISYIGYLPLELTFARAEDIPQVINLKPAPTALDLVTVTGSRFEQSLVKSSVSIDIIKPDLLRSTNAVTSDKILNKVPGVQILDGQANIRGGSGYSYGAGSRVMLLIDDIPALQPDAGFPNWSDIPIENLSQIEILKGAASSLYGSAALNGIINFRSSYAKSEPETRISAASSIFMAPKDASKKWWNDTTRYELNASFVHKQKFGKWDVIFSGLFNQLRSINQFTNETRGRGNINLRYRHSEKLSYQLGVMYNANESNSFFLWQNSVSGAMKPFPGTVSDRFSRRMYIDPKITYFDKYGNTHKLMARTIIVNNENNTNQSNKSLNQYIEYQIQRNIEKYGLMVTAGAVGAWNKTDSQILGDSTFYGRNYASYFQLDKSFGSKWTITGGLRYEYVAQQSPEIFLGDTIPDGKASDGKLIGRFSANYLITPYSSLRASYGQGYRYPTLTERFVTTTFGQFSIFANPSLQPESGWTTELGYKQGYKIGGLKGFIDLAAFYSEYQNMIEFTFVADPSRLGFQPQNIGDTRISGFEIGIFGQANLWGLPLNIFGGYTYIDPIYKNFDASDEIKNSVSDGVNVLKYRSNHQLKMDVEATIKKFKWGVAFQQVSHVINVDRAFVSVPPFEQDIFAIGDYRKANNKGFLLVDTRLSYILGKLTVTALVNNVFNEEYTLRPALIEPSRNIGLRLDYQLN